ncbi:MAG: 3-isopropylmalate dehydratase small subunit [Gemmatimonadota bacterium]
MNPFTIHTGIVAALPRTNVDTDQIIPKQFLKRLERSGFGKVLFHDWRYLPDGSPNPAFELNRPEARGATVLLTGSNFGCGSSREHALWALSEYGFRAIIAPSFADIFDANCLQNGILPVRLADLEVAELFRRARGRRYAVTVDLPAQTVTDAEGFRAGFPIDRSRKQMLLEGLDTIRATLAQEKKIEQFERRRMAQMRRFPI